MQTASVSTPAIVTAGSASAGKAAEADAASMPFGDVLSREVAGRGNAADAAPAAKPVQGQAPNRTEAGEKADAASAQDDSAADEDENAAPAQAATPADLLALMASMNPARPAIPAGKAEATGAVADGAADVPGMSTAQLAALQHAGALAAKGKPGGVAGHANVLSADRQAGRRAEHQAVDARDEERPAGKEAKSAPADELRAKSADAHSRAMEDGLDKLVPKQASGTEFKEAVATAQAAAAIQQPATVSAAQAAGAAAHMADHIAPRVGTPDWGNAVAQKVSWMVAGDQQSASLTLNPPDLGPLQVVLNVTNSHADAAFTAAQPEVRQALEAAMPRLREMLSEAGIQLGQATVGSGAPNQQGTPQQRQFQPGARGDGGDAADASLRATRVQTLSSGRGMVDTFA